MEDLIKEIREKIRQRQEFAKELYQKFVAFADEESDPFKKEVAETVAATQFDISSMWSDVEKLYVVELVNAEKIKLLYELITLTLLPEVTKDSELIKRVKEEIHYLNDRIRNLQEEEGIP
jgi:hypothetical protein